MKQNISRIRGDMLKKRLGEFKKTGESISSWWSGNFSSFRINFSFGASLVLKSDHENGLIFENVAHSGGSLYAWQENGMWVTSAPKGQFTAKSLEVALAKALL